MIAVMDGVNGDRGEEVEETARGTGEEPENEDDTTPLATQDHTTPLATQYDEPVNNSGSDDSNGHSRFRSRPAISTTDAHGSQDEDNTHPLEVARHDHYHSMTDDHMPALYHMPLTRRTLDLVTTGSTQSSTGSLKALSEHDEIDTALQRVHSARSTQSGNRGRSISHSKAASTPQPGSRRFFHGDHFYPDQSFAQLSTSVLSRPQPVLRTRSSHPAQNLMYNDMSRTTVTPVRGRRTADNTPMSSPGLFTLSAVRNADVGGTRASNPQLHHLQAPKETHTAEIEHDVYSGNKFINNYEIIAELGRGEHGKVKLGRDIEKDTMVAIKIVPRYSAKRRLGKLGAPEDRTKKEVAILKKARHPNVVSLLEVIDDPSKNKVYLILEFVDMGEIKWRKAGVREILAVNNLRFEQERLGAQLTTEPTDRDYHIVRQAQIRHERLESLRERPHDLSHIPNWSLEYAGDTDEEGEMLEMPNPLSRQITRDGIPTRGNSQDDYVGLHEPALAGSMYGAYTPDAYRARKFSAATSAISHMSSDIGFEPDDDQRSFVPALTLEEARRAFRDTLVGLDFLHFIGIIHRDIKPANLLTSSTRMVKISDFGVSYLGRPTTDEEAEEKVGPEAAPLDNEKELARSVGTPAFWAPELCYEDPSMFADGKDPKITGALDLWALGITLYCMIYARLPFYLNDEMGLHEAICTATVFCPRTRLVPVDTTSPDFVSRSQVPINGNKRLDYELKFEYVPDSVRDLIGKLLTKDPAKRITIPQAKRHPWVVEGLSDQTEWLQGPIEKEGKKKILEINEKELSHAVVKRNIIERALTTAGRFAGSLLGRRDGRKRASSAATSAGSSSESLTAPSVGGKISRSREARRTSLRGDEVVQALKASREPTEHPLAQSQTASPESKGPSSYFETLTTPSPGTTPAESERRPRPPDRAVSALSTADSIMTIRASQQRPEDRQPDGALKSKFEGLWEGTAKSLARHTALDAYVPKSRSSSRPTSESDGHADASLAVSNTYAAGAISKPHVLEASASQPLPVASEHERHAEDNVSSHTTIHAPISSSADFEEAQYINHRRYMQEIQDRISHEDEQTAAGGTVECPPSPDHLALIEQTETSSTTDSTPAGFPTAASASTISSSVDEFCDSSVSNPSFGIASGASSPPEGFTLADYKDAPKYVPVPGEPDFMRTADTVTAYDATAAGKALEEQHEFYDGGEEGEDSDDDDGMVMGAPRIR